MVVGCADEGRGLRRLGAVVLRWTECGVGSFRWWETAPAEALVRRAVVIWLRDLGQVTWWIADGETTLRLEHLPSVEPPSDAVIELAKRMAEQCWRELAS